MEERQLTMPADMSGRVAAITGAGGGLGGATARLLARRGHPVALIDNRREPLDSLADELIQMGSSPLVLEANLTETAQCENLVGQIVEHFGQVDILVNCAAILARHELDEYSEADFIETFLTNAAAPFFLTRSAMADMAKRSWGRVVNVTSTGVYEGGFTMTSALYEGSKGAVAVFTKMFARFGAAHGILVNSLCPGGMRTRMLIDQTPKELVEKAEREMIPLGRLADPAEMASMIGWLVSDENTYATGAEFDVTGGLAIH